MPAIPALIMAAGAIGSSAVAAHAASSAQSAAQQRSPEELGFLTAQTGLADSLRQQGQQLFGTAMPGLRSTLDYYQSLLSGDRAARMNAVSGEAQDTSAAYQGSANNIKRTLRGGERDQALAENATGRAGAISRLVTGVRPQAAAATGQLGGSLLGAAAGAQGEAGNIGANLLGNSTSNRQNALAYGQQAGSSTGQNFGKLFGNLLATLGGMKWGGGAQGLAKPMPAWSTAGGAGSEPLPY